MTVADAEKMNLRERKKLRARSDILAAANTLIARKGYADTTMREIADTANVSYQTLYNYFPSKAQIVRAMLTDVAQVDAKLTKILTGAEPLVTKLQRVVKHYFDLVAHRERALWREIILEVFKNAPEYLVLRAVKIDAGYQVLRTLLNEAQDSGELDPYVDTDLLAQTLHAITDFTFLRFVLDTNPSKVVLLNTLRAQIVLLVQPYLRV
jgi:TetR/AcrR family transcriptional regulator, cholesterol catabolism regulator